jgi:hypothetical protein
MTETSIEWRLTKNPYAYMEWTPSLYAQYRRDPVGLPYVIVQKIKRVPRFEIRRSMGYKDNRPAFATFKTLEAAQLAYRMLPKPVRK